MIDMGGHLNFRKSQGVYIYISLVLKSAEVVCDL